MTDKFRFVEGKVYQGKDKTARRIVKIETRFTKSKRPFEVVCWNTVNFYKDRRVPFRREEGTSLPETFHSWIIGEYRDGLKPPILKPR